MSILLIKRITPVSRIQSLVACATRTLGGTRQRLQNRADLTLNMSSDILVADHVKPILMIQYRVHELLPQERLFHGRAPGVGDVLQACALGDGQEGMNHVINGNMFHVGVCQMRHILLPGTRPPIAWHQAKAQFAIHFEECFVVTD